jgi:DNA-binding NarL/FixJ family response regulator
MNVVIADDSLLVRRGLAQLLVSAGFEVIAEVADAASLLREVALLRPAAVIVDIRMPPTHSDEGLRAAAQIRHTHPQTVVLVLSQYLQTAYALRLLTEAPAGVGYLLKDRVSDFAVVTDVLRRLIEGDCVLDPTIVSRLMRRARKSRPLERLTARESDILRLMAEGRSNSAIARTFGTSVKTTEGSISQILSKLEIPATADDNRRVLAVLEYLSGPDQA